MVLYYHILHPGGGSFMLPVIGGTRCNNEVRMDQQAVFIAFHSASGEGRGLRKSPISQLSGWALEGRHGPSGTAY